MKTAVVGGGILGLVLAHRLARRGIDVELIEAAPILGGLVAPYDYGEFRWDRFYHCILPQDRRLTGWLEDLGLGSELRWHRTGTGYWAGGRFYSMSGSRDFLAFPLLSLPQKARLALTVLRAMHTKDPYALYGETAQAWLVRSCGRRVYEVFWRPLLAAKFGPFHDRVAAIFVWATITRLFAARSGAANAEHLGYVSGGYGRILDRARSVLEAHGTIVRTGAQVTAIEEARNGSACWLTTRNADGHQRTRSYRQVFFAAPTSCARAAATPSVSGYLEALDRCYPSSTSYLGVACVTLVLRRPLMPYYVLNIGDQDIGLTGVIEMTSLVDAGAETNGRSLVYLPHYLPSDSAQLGAPDEAIVADLVDGGLRRIFPDLATADVVATAVHRARTVQPLPLVREDEHYVPQPPPWRSPLVVLNTSMLECATLNNDEVVGLVDDFVARNEASLRELAAVRRHGDAEAQMRPAVESAGDPPAATR